jgi:adenosine kinase
MLSDRTGLSHADISRQVRGLVVTLGAHGCEVWEGGQKTVVAPVKAQAVVDPTGCGDAWRGALLFGLGFATNFEWDAAFLLLLLIEMD